MNEVFLFSILFMDTVHLCYLRLSHVGIVKIFSNEVKDFNFHEEGLLCYLVLVIIGE